LGGCDGPVPLAHAIGDKVEAAYRRGDLLTKRRQLLMKWEEYIEQLQSKGRLDTQKTAPCIYNPLNED